MQTNSSQDHEAENYAGRMPGFEDALAPNGNPVRDTLTGNLGSPTDCVIVGQIHCDVIFPCVTDHSVARKAHAEYRNALDPLLNQATTCQALSER